jgi:hypothetical protein
MQHLDGCTGKAGKYVNRLHQEIVRCYTKVASEQNEFALSDRRNSPTAIGI